MTRILGHYPLTTRIHFDQSLRSHLHIELGLDPFPLGLINLRGVSRVSIKG